MAKEVVMIWATLGGVTIGFAILIWFISEWFPGKKALMKDPFGQLVSLLPFLFGWAYGALGVLSVGGLIGWIFDSALWVTNWLGDAALWLGVGTQAGVSSRGNYLPLTTYGSCAVLLATVAVLAVIKFRRCGRDVKLGAWCGGALGTSGGVAGLAAVPLAQGANWLGELVYTSWASA